MPAKLVCLNGRDNLISQLTPCTWLIELSIIHNKSAMLVKPEEHSLRQIDCTYWCPLQALRCSYTP